MKLGEYVNEGAIVVLEWGDRAARDFHHWSANGDERWVAVAPKWRYPSPETLPSWMDETRDPRGSVDVHDADSHWVVIGSHA